MAGEEVPDEVNIWPAFIDADLTRSQGRRLPKRLCVRSPTVEELLDASITIGVKARIEKKALPRRWHSERKALVLEERVPRSDVLSRLAEIVRRSRSA